MPVDARLDSLFSRWCEAQARGEDLSLDQLCGGDAGLAGELARCLDDMRQVEGLMQQAAQEVAPNDLPDTLVAETNGTSAAPRFGRFHLLRQLGQGGFGVVYLALDPTLNRQVALKLPRPDLPMVPALRKRFVREALVAAGLDHPHLVPVHEAGEVGRVWYIASAYVPGVSLAGWLRQRPGRLMDPRIAARLVACLAEAVHHAHQRGVVHRDLKPGNVLLHQPQAEEPVPAGGWPTELGVPRVCDFGLARQLEGPADDTCSGAVVGTPEYMAPEQAAGRPREVGPATDVYALGAILFECLTGRPPFVAEDRLAVLPRVVSEAPPLPTRLRPGLPRDLEAICLKCLEKDPARRYAGADALADDLGRSLDGRPTLARPLGPWPRAVAWCRRRPAAALLLCATALAVPALGAGVAWHQARLREHGDAVWAESQREREAEEEARRAEARRQAVYARSIADVAARWRDGRATSLCPRLAPLLPAPGEKDLRGFEWHYLWRQGTLHSLGPGHDSQVDAVAFSPDGRRCISAGTGKDVAIWDLAGGRRLDNRDFQREPGEFTRLTPDGKVLLSASVETEKTITLRLWDVADWRLLGQRVIADGFSTIFAVALSPDGSTVAYPQEVPKGKSVPQEVRLWHPRTGRDHVLCPPETGGVTCACFSPDGRYLALASNRFLTKENRFTEAIVVDMWDVTDGRRKASWITPHATFIFSLAFSPDGRLLATGSADQSVRTWDAATGQSRGQLPVFGHVITNLAFAPDGKTLAVVDGVHDRRVLGGVSVWDVASNTRRGPILESKLIGSVRSLAFTPDGKTLACGNWDGVVHLWEPGERPQHTSLAGHAPKEAWSVSFSPDSKTLASSGDDHAVRLWDVATGRQKDAFVDHGSLATCVAYSPDGRRIASGSFDKTVKVRDLATGRVAFSLDHEDFVCHVAFSPDGRMLASRVRDKWVRVWDAATGAPRATLVGPEAPGSPPAFAGSRLLATGTSNKTVRLWDTDNWKPVREFDDDAQIDCLAVSPDGKTLATGNNSGHVRLWETATGRELRLIEGHNNREVRAVAFSPDGKTLASAGDDKMIRLWHVATGAELLSFKDQPHQINSLAFSPDGKYLAAAIHDGSIRLWQADVTGE